MKRIFASFLTLCLLASCIPTPTPPDLNLDRVSPDMPIFREGLADPSVLAEMDGATA